MASPRTNPNGEIVRRDDPQNDLRAAIHSRVTQIKRVVEAATPKGVSATQMLSCVARACMKTPKLMDCTMASFAACVYNIASLGLWPNDPRGHAYLIPFGKECQLIIGYKGYRDLAYRSGLVTGMRSAVVREGDLWVFEDGLSPVLRHTPKVYREGREGITHAWAAADLRQAGTIFCVLPIEEVEAARRRGASGRGTKTPWDEFYASMAIKTAMRRMLNRYAPSSAELVSFAVSVDESSTPGPGDHSVLEASGFIVDTTAEEVPAERQPGDDHE